MNIFFTQSQFNSLICESETFRGMIYGLLVDPIEDLRQEIKRRFKDEKSVIPAIKWLREEMKGNGPLLKKLADLGYYTYYNSPNCHTLGIADSKRFVGSCK